MKAATAIPVCLVLCAAAFAGGRPAATGAAPSPIKKGRALYTSLSCSACHTIDGSGGAGPTFRHLYGRRVKLSTGKTVIATDAYLIRSIRDPDAQIVAGRPRGVMTTVIRKGEVPLADAKALVAFIKSLK
jgi:mono/diheme cytochrome c family protein